MEHEVRLYKYKIQDGTIERGCSKIDCDNNIGKGLMTFQSIVRRNRAVLQYSIMTQGDSKRKTVAVLLQSHFEDGMDGCCLD